MRRKCKGAAKAAPFSDRRKRDRLKAVSSFIPVKFRDSLLSQYAEHAEHEGADGQHGEAVDGLVAEQLESLADAHVDAACADVEERAVRQTVKDEYARVGHGCGSQRRDAARDYGRPEDLACEGRACGSGRGRRAHHHAGDRREHEGGQAERFNAGDDNVLERGVGDDARERARADQ